MKKSHKENKVLLKKERTNFMSMYNNRRHKQYTNLFRIYDIIYLILKKLNNSLRKNESFVKKV